MIQKSYTLFLCVLFLCLQSKAQAQSTVCNQPESSPFPRVCEDIHIYDLHIEKRRNEFAQKPANIHDKKWVKMNLEFLVEIDQYMRRYTSTPTEQNYSKEETDFFWKEFSSRFRNMDKKNTLELKKLIDVYSWFNISSFGKKADQNGWLLTQHADHDRDFQKQILATLETLLPAKETSLRNYAYLFDRVAMSFHDPSKREKQRFGTQGRCVGPKKWEPFPVEDPENLNSRRNEMGLETMEEYQKRVETICS